MKVAIYITLFIFGCANAQVTNIPCEFDDTPRGYECRLPDVDLSQFLEFAIVGGVHLPNRGDINVVSFMSVNNNFRVFPNLARFQNLRHIKVSGSEIEQLNAGDVINRPLLETLGLTNNHINVVDPLAFTGTPNIVDLNLGFNRIRNIDNSFFEMFPNLLNLDLSFNLLERVPADAFVNNPSLLTLNLNANRISFVNQTFFENVLNLTALQFNVNLCYNGAFFNIHLPANRIDMFMRMQPCFTMGPVLFRCLFGFEFGGISFDGRYTCLLRQVEAFDFTKVINLGGFHVGTNTNANVHFVWVDNANVKFFISQIFQDFVNLQGVQIQASGLEIIQQGAFQNANNLRELTITINRLRVLEPHTFQGATNLEVIRLWNNELEYISEDAFHGLVNLRELHLLGGFLLNIPPYTFSPLINLNIFEASQNLVEIIDSNWFVNNTQLAQISFNDNDIYAIHSTLVDMPNLTTLRLWRNRCIDNEFSITAETREAVRVALNTCFESYPLRRRNFTMELEGDLSILDDEGNVVLDL